MTALVERNSDSDIVETALPKQKLAIDQLAAALRRRIGWVDEAISPFARGDKTKRPTSRGRSSGTRKRPRSEGCPATVAPTGTS